jgi:carboxyl-terminal processing protease
MKVKFYLLIFLVFGYTNYHGFAQKAEPQSNFEISKNLDIFISAYKQLEVNYVDEINPGQLVKTALDAMLETLDPYTVYIPESDIEDYRFMTTGQYGGIGALIYKRGNYVCISEPYENAPADKAGLKMGDKIIEINGKSAKGKTVDEVSTALKGQPGTELNLLIERDSLQKPFEKKIIREEIKINNVPFSGEISEGVGYINLSEFRANAANEVKEAFLKMSQEKKLKGVIIDLRGNGGGLLNEAVNIVNIFVDKGQIVCSTKGKIKENNHNHITSGSAVDKDIPLIILVDGYSASASEIVAGSIQDLDRGVIVGSKTFGKGLVQNIVPLTYNSEMKVTIAKYYIPSGRCVQAIDYFNKDEEGVASKVPDSLLKPFKTKAGRTVMEGSGIMPDIEIERPVLKDITISLLTKNLMLDYAIYFYRTHPNIDPATKFKITDEIFNDFVNFIKDKDYSYVTKTEEELENFKKQAEKDNYFESIKSSYEQMHESLANMKKNDLTANKEEIKRILKSLIIPQYYYQKGRIEASITDDKDVKKAIEIFNNPVLYQSILNGSYHPNK